MDVADPQPPIPEVPFEELSREVRELVIRLQSQEQARLARFGHVRPPVSVDHAGHKIVAVGSRIFWDPKWKTFPDFLITYLATVLGKEWGDAELQKPFEERHPVVQWYHQVCQFQARHADAPGAEKIYSATGTGPVMAYVALAYDLYTLEHHALLQGKLVDRLKGRDQFQGARYETYVAAAFVRAGFDVELEDEVDRRTSHCEFTATHRASGGKYSVEAKSRHRPGYLGHPGSPEPLHEIEADASNLLARALRKRADHERVIFVDVNVPPQEDPVLEADWFGKVASQLRRLEESQRPGDPWPAAFVFLTNHPYHDVGNDAPEPGRRTIFTAINMPDFRRADAEIVVRRYPAMIDLFDSVVRHTEVPNEW